MKRIKVKFCSSWQESESITKLLLNQFNTPELDLTNIEFVYDNSYDVIVYNNYVTEKPKLGSKSFIFFHEPSWSGSHQKNFSEYDNITVFGHYKELYNSNNFIEVPAHMFYGGRGTWCEGWDFWTYNNLINNEFNKTKNISSVVSSLGSNGGEWPLGCLYNERSNLIKGLIEKVNFVDFYCWGIDNKNLKGDVKEKKDGLVDYRFSICIENTQEKNYVSEKFYDCVLTNTIPIYFGCKNIKSIWPENGYFLIEDINDIDGVVSILNYINNNPEEIYNKMLPELLKIKERYFSENNLLKLITKNLTCQN